MNETLTSHRLEELLQELEVQLETPIISGELRTWLDSVGHMVAELGPVLRERVQNVHPRQFKQIRKDADNLLREIEMMKREDEAILNELALHERAVPQLCELAKKAEPDELRFADHVKNLVREGLQFIIRVRTQERAIETWMQEAEFRDNGNSGAG